MVELLRALYRHAPLSDSVRSRIAESLPLRYRRRSQFRRYGSINELYLWRTDRDIETVAPIQNFYSFLFPELDTATEGHLWIFDRDGTDLVSEPFSISHSAIHEVRFSDRVPRGIEYGSFMWHLKVPDSVAALREVSEGHVYFTDRGYVFYVKAGVQPVFMHGVDRYAVFQEQEVVRHGLFYEGDWGTYSWRPEFPVRSGMQEEVEVVLLNRSPSLRTFTVALNRGGGGVVQERSLKVAPKGAGIIRFGCDVLESLGAEDGYFQVDGMPTQWGRPAIMRHFPGGAMSAMHC